MVSLVTMIKTVPLDGWKNENTGRHVDGRVFCVEPPGAHDELEIGLPQATEEVPIRHVMI